MNDELFGEESSLHEYAREKIEKEQTYERDYVGLCVAHDAVPVSIEEYVDKYVEILGSANNMKERAELYQEQDKIDILDMLEETGMPDPDDVALLERFPCIMYSFLNVMETGVIALLVIFEDQEMVICPVYFDKDKEEMELPPGIEGAI